MNLGPDIIDRLGLNKLNSPDLRIFFRLKILTTIFMFSAICALSQTDTLKKDSALIVTPHFDKFNPTQTYRIGLPHVPGLMSRDDMGKANGFALEIFEAIAIEEGIRYEWIDGTWNDLFNKLQKGEIDALPGTQESESRKQFLDFTTNSLYSIWSELYINNESVFEHISQLQGKKIGLVIGDNNAVGFLNYISGFSVEIIPVFFNNHFEALRMLSTHQIYGMAGPTPNIISDLPPNIKNSGLYFNPSDLKISFKKNNKQELREKIDKRLGIYKANSGSVYYQLFKKYNLSELKDAEEWKMPEWLKIMLLLSSMALLIAVLFVIALKKRVDFRTKELANRQIYLNKAMEVGEMGTWNFNLKDQELYFSDEVFKITGIKMVKNKLHLDDLKNFVHPGDINKLINNFHLVNNKSTSNYYRLINKNKEVVFVKIFGLVQTGKANIPEMTIGLIQNVTAQLEHEHELIASKEKAEASEKLIASFLANMSHEIRTPLNSIVGFSDLLIKEDLSMEKKIEFKEIILKQNELLLTLINDILDISRIQAGSMEIEPNDLISYKVIDDVFNSYLPQCPDDIEFKKVILLPDADNCSFLSDRNRIVQILNNLVSNAFKYTQEGSIQIGCRHSIKEGYFDIFVKDTGQGIPKKKQRKIFDRFSKLDSMKQGVGLGLTISQSLANMLGSEIKLYSEPGKGSEFYLSFPFKTKK